MHERFTRVVNTLYWPHTALSVYRVCYFLLPHTHVLCMGSGSATGFFYAVRLVHSLLKYFFKFKLWYWIQIYTTKYSNLLLIILILVWIVCSTYRKGEILIQKWHVTSQFVYCYKKKTYRSAQEGGSPSKGGMFPLMRGLAPLKRMGSGSATGFFLTPGRD